MDKDVTYDWPQLVGRAVLMERPDESVWRYRVLELTPDKKYVRMTTNTYPDSSPAEGAWFKIKSNDRTASARRVAVFEEARDQ